MLTIDWLTKVISVPQSYLTLISGTLYELDTNQFRLDLKTIETSSEGMAYDRTHRHNTEVVVAGTTYARTVEIINNYSVEFEDGAYSVRLVNSNNNIWDIQNNILVQNQVQVIPTNSAGLIVTTSGSGVTEQDKLDIADRVWDEVATEHQNVGSFGEIATEIEIIKKMTSNKVTASGDVITIFEDNGIDIFRQYNLANGERIQI